MQGMRERRVYDGNELLFDARSILDQRRHRGNVLVKMISGPISYESPEGVKFWNAHPFQWVSEAERSVLLNLVTPVFESASYEQLEDYYAY